MNQCKIHTHTSPFLNIISLSSLMRHSNGSYDYCLKVFQETYYRHYTPIYLENDDYYVVANVPLSLNLQHTHTYTHT